MHFVFSDQICSNLIYWENWSRNPPPNYIMGAVEEERKITCTTDVLLFSGYNPALLRTCVQRKRKGEIQHFTLQNEEVTEQIMTLSLTCDRLHSCV